MSNFSFFQSVFKRLVLKTHKNQGLVGKELKKKKDAVLLYMPRPGGSMVSLVVVSLQGV